jgi:tRNA U34 5-carboxymethylaminomethyl modifying enzyme MnmG/GidA
VDDGCDLQVSHLNTALQGQLNNLVSDPVLCERLKIEAVYASAIEDQEDEVRQICEDESIVLPDDLDYNE